MSQPDFLAMLQSLDDHDEVREEYVRAPFGFPGAKSRSFKQILPHLPYRIGYCEPFGGAGTCLLARRPSKLEIFNDRFAGVTCFYRVLRDSDLKHQLMERLQLIQHGREEFIWSKKTWKNCEDDVERAARWWYMVNASFGSLGRNFGRSTQGIGSIGNKLKNNLELFHQCHLRLQNVQIENLDWRTMFRDYDNSNMVWYIDPPYYEYCKGVYECEMSKEEHGELLERIWKLEGFVALSGYDNPLYDSYDWNYRHTWTVSVTMLAQDDTQTGNHSEVDLHRGKAQEVLWIKEAA